MCAPAHLRRAFILACFLFGLVKEATAWWSHEYAVPEACSSPRFLVSALEDLQTALANATDADCIGVTATVQLSSSSMIDLYATASMVAITGMGQHPIFKVKNETSVRIQNLTIVNGSTDDGSGGGCVQMATGSTLHLASTRLLSCESSVDGGAVLVGQGGSLTLSGASLISGSQAGESGGAIVSLGGSVVIEGSSQLINNAALDSGGAIALYPTKTFNSSLVLRGHSLVANNQAPYGGGILSFSARVNISKCALVANNSASVYGGAFYEAYSGVVKVSGNASITGNEAYSGGAFALTGGAIIVEGSASITHNKADVMGGGVAIEEHALAVLQGSADCSHNSAESGGCMAQVSGGVSLLRGNATVRHNRASYGGGIFAMNATLVVAFGGSSFDNNTATSGFGGALGVYRGAEALLSGNVRFTDNQAALFGGAIGAASGSYLAISGHVKFLRNRLRFVTFDGKSLLPASDDTLTGGGAVGLMSSSEADVAGAVEFGGNAADYGGAIMVINGCVLRLIDDVQLHDNVAVYRGGGVDCTAFAGTPSVAILIGNITIHHNNCTEGVGGGLSAYGSMVLFSLLSIHSNTAVAGGGVSATMGSTMVFSGAVAVTSNRAAQFAGGLLAYGDTTTVTSFPLGAGPLLLSGNLARSKGANCFALMATLELSGAVLSDATVASSGGCLAVEANATAALVNCTLTNCSSGSSGGAVASWGSTLVLNRSTIADCAASERGGALSVSGGRASVHDTAFRNASVPFLAQGLVGMYLYDGDGGWQGAEYFICEGTLAGSACGRNATGLVISGTLGKFETYRADYFLVYAGLAYTVRVTESRSPSELGWILGLSWLVGGAGEVRTFTVSTDLLGGTHGGGAVHLGGAATADLVGCVFDDTVSELTSGGAIYVDSDSLVDTTEATVAYSEFYNCRAGLYGSSIFSSLSDVTVVNSFFEDEDDTRRSISGTVFNSGGDVYCWSDCELGYYGNCSMIDGGDCASCPLTQRCRACPVGMVGVSAKASSLSQGCGYCDTGRASSTPGLSACTLCPSGRYATTLNSSNTGVGVTYGAEVCMVCPTGRFASTSGQTGCTQCPNHMTTFQVGSSSCSCEEGKYMKYLSTGTTCEDCPSWATCEGGVYAPKPISGYWVDRSDSKNYDFMYECPSSTCKSRGDDECWEYDGENWTEAGALGSKCDSDELMCQQGATGPMCGSCSNGYSYNSCYLECVKCGSLIMILAPVFMTTILAGFVVLALYYKCRQIDEEVEDEESITSGALLSRMQPPAFVKYLYAMDTSKLKVLWVTLQIISSVSWTLNVQFPEPFASMLHGFTVFQLDFYSAFSLDCTESDFGNVLVQVIVSSLIPMFLVLLTVIAYFVRKTKLRRLYEAPQPRASVHHRKVLEERKAMSNEDDPETPDDLLLAYHEDLQELWSKHVYYMLLITYLFLPSVSRLQFRGFDCVELKNGERYLRMDTEISCSSERYKEFVDLNALLLAIYQCVPICYASLLWAWRERLNPVDVRKSPRRVYEERAEDKEISHLSFLFGDYKCDRYYFEVIDIYRRIAFVGLLVLIRSDTSRAVAGCGLAIISLICFHEAAPYFNDSTNLLANVAQVQIFVTYFGALVIKTDALSSVHDTTVGVLLILANLILLFFASYMGMTHVLREQEARLAAFNSAEFSMINHVLERPTNAKSMLAEDVLQQLLLDSHDVRLEKKIGAGAFGDVFKGRCLGHPCAIKTMKEVTEDNLLSFRAEILLTAVLRHPNVVNLVGACWDRSLTAMVLEWVDRGALSDIIEDVNATWDGAILQLLTDVSRGLGYLHQRHYYDEVTNTTYNRVIHRDLKPDNILVTKMLCAKISDFGMSRAIDAGGNMSAVGTPLYCAPEIMRGDPYDESCDIYSLGLIFLDASMTMPVLDFLREEYRKHLGRKRPPSWVKVLGAMNNDGWRPNLFVNIPPSVANLIRNCMDSDPANRPNARTIVEILAGPVLVEVMHTSYPRTVDKTPIQRQYDILDQLTVDEDSTEKLMWQQNPQTPVSSVGDSSKSILANVSSSSTASNTSAVTTASDVYRRRVTTLSETQSPFYSAESQEIEMLALGSNAGLKELEADSGKVLTE